MRYVGRANDCAKWLRQRAAELAAQGKDDALFEVRLWKRKRSLTQNAYYWALLNRLGLALGYPSDELHGHMLRSYGPCDVFTVRADVPLGHYFRYYDVVGVGRLDGREYRHVRVFKGSSEMDSNEFSKLLNGCIEECRQQGIETMTQAEAARLRWVEGE